jgi:hypothetical protein
VCGPSMHIEISDPSSMDDLRVYLQRHGCPSEVRSADTFEVRVLWSPETPLSDAQMRTKVFEHMRAWCQRHPGIKANLHAE